MVLGGLPVVLALQARGLALPVLFVTAWVCLALLWRDPTFQRDQLWRREQLRTWLRGPLALALGVCTLIALGLSLIEPRAAHPRRASAPGVLTRGEVGTSTPADTTPPHPSRACWHGDCSCFPA